MPRQRATALPRSSRARSMLRSSIRRLISRRSRPDFPELGDTKPFAEGIPFAVGRERRLGGAHRDTLVDSRAITGARWAGFAIPPTKQQAVDILVKRREEVRRDSADAYDYLVAKLKLFGLDGEVSDAVYDKMADGLAEIGLSSRLIRQVGDRLMAVCQGGAVYGDGQQVVGVRSARRWRRR